jgi:transposase
VQRLLDHLKELDRQVDELEAKIHAWHRSSEASCKLAQIPGIGPITASALIASIGDAKNVDGGRQLAAWLGLVPRQHSSGDKPNLPADVMLATMQRLGVTASRSRPAVSNDNPFSEALFCFSLHR